MSNARSTHSFGWYVVAASFVIMFLNAGARLMIGVLVKPIIADFGWSRGAVSMAVFVNMAVFAAAIVVSGRLCDRYWPKWIILVSSVLFSSGIMLMAVMTSLWQFVLFCGVIAAAGTRVALHRRPSPPAGLWSVSRSTGIRRSLRPAGY
jgi:MFS family permease